MHADETAAEDHCSRACERDGLPDIRPLADKQNAITNLASVILNWSLQVDPVL
jgi:hypothetical protein